MNKLEEYNYIKFNLSEMKARYNMYAIGKEAFLATASTFLDCFGYGGSYLYEKFMPNDTIARSIGREDLTKEFAVKVIDEAMRILEEEFDEYRGADRD